MLQLIKLYKRNKLHEIKILTKESINILSTLHVSTNFGTSPTIMTFFASIIWYFNITTSISFRDELLIPKIIN